MTNKRISLDKNDFKTLVSGGVVEQNGAKIILRPPLLIKNLVGILVDQAYECGCNEAANEILG